MACPAVAAVLDKSNNIANVVNGSDKIKALLHNEQQMSYGKVNLNAARGLLGLVVQRVVSTRVHATSN